MTDRLKYLIGGSASTGSSLLAHLLDNHSELLCGAETNLFVIPELLEDWGVNRQLINSKTKRESVMSRSWHVHKGLQLSHLKIDSKIDELLSASIDFGSFSDQLFLQHDSDVPKTFYAEKTPSNAVHFQTLIEYFTSTYFILTIRNPYDAIASMTNRGWSTVYATGLYLFNISLGYARSERLLTVKYEDLIKDRIEVLRHVFSKVDLDYQQGMETEGESMQRIGSWTNIDSQSSSFSILPKEKQEEITFFIQHLKFKKDFSYKGNSLRFSSINEIIEEFEYKSVDKPLLKSRKKIKYSAQLNIEKAKRALKGYTFGGHDFPFEIQSF